MGSIFERIVSEVRLEPVVVFDGGFLGNAKLKGRSDWPIRCSFSALKVSTAWPYQAGKHHRHSASTSRTPWRSRSRSTSMPALARWSWGLPLIPQLPLRT